MHTTERHPDIDAPTTYPDHIIGALTITTATATDLQYIQALARKHVNSIGFVPTTAIADHLKRNSYRLVTCNGDPIGFSMCSGGIRKPYRLIQVAIATDAWRNGLGTILIREALRRAATRPIPAMTASVRHGLPMNDVVTSTGAILTQIDTRTTARRKPLNLYRWEPPTPRHPNGDPTTTPRLTCTSLPSTDQLRCASLQQDASPDGTPLPSKDQLRCAPLLGPRPGGGASLRSAVSESHPPPGKEPLPVRNLFPSERP